MLRELLLQQFDISWGLASYHLEGLTDEECLWRPAATGLTVREGDGRWVADWPDREGYDIGPPSIAWTTWHICWWWSTVFDHLEGDGSLTKEDVAWPGSAQAVRERLTELHDNWRSLLEECNSDDFKSTDHDLWPLPKGTFADVAAWLNVELMKNAAEIGYGRFLYGVRRGGDA